VVLSHLARQSAFFYPISVAVTVFAAGYCLVSGRWGWFAAVVILAVLNWFTYLFARGWVRSGEDNEIRVWIRENPDFEPGVDGPVPD